MTSNVDATVVIACHSMARWSFTMAAIESALAQDPPPSRVIVVSDNNLGLHSRLCAELKGVVVLLNTGERGASATRNLGVAHADTTLVAFLDDDARARPQWLDQLVAPFADPDVVGTGGGIDPEWEGSQPHWFPAEFRWAIGASYEGMPTTIERVRNVWSGNMAVRRVAFDRVGGFRAGFGKIGDASRPEDTDFCIRVAAGTSGTWMYVPEARVDHRVPQERGTFRFFLKRCYAEGRGKIEMSRLLDEGGSLGAEGEYMRRVLPRGVRRGISAAVVHGHFSGLSRAGAIVAGAAASGFGASRALLSGKRGIPSAAGPLSEEAVVPTG